MFRIKGHREAGNGLPATEWPLLAAAGQPAEFHTKEEAERLVSMCNAALAHSPARITYAVEEAPEIRRVPIVVGSASIQVEVTRDVWLSPTERSVAWAEWPADDTGAPLTT